MNKEPPGTKTKVNDEHYRLGGRKPLVTLFALLLGPLLSQVTNSLYGLVSSLWVSKGYGVFGLKVLSSIFLFDYITFAFGELMVISVSTQMSYLFGSLQEKSAPQVVVDFIRLCFLFGTIIPAVLLPLVKIVVKWLTSDSNVTDEAFKYMLPLLCASSSELVYLTCIGVLQGEGRTMISGFVQTLSLCVNMFVLNPLFVLKLKVGVWGAAISTVIAEFIPGLILSICILSGKFSLKFECRMFLNPLSEHTKQALKVGFASFMLNLSSSVPEFALQKYMALCADAIGELTPILALWDTFSRFFEVGLSVMYAFDASYLPAASYAYGKREYSRYLRLSYHTLWITFVWCALFAAVMCLFPQQIASLWNKDERFLYWAKELFPIGFLTLPLWPISSLSISFLEAGNYPGRASFLSVVTTFIPLPVISTIIYFFGSKDPRLQFSSYIWNDITKSIISVSIVLKPFITFKKAQDYLPIPEHSQPNEESFESKSESYSQLLSRPLLQEEA